MDDLGAKILSNLNAAFSRDPDIDEYDFLPIDGPLRNKNPVITAGHKVGLELWAVKVLYLYAHSRLVEHTVKEAGRKALGVEEILSLSRAVLLVNADFMSAWNKRRELILQAELSIEEDLRLAELVLTKHPKSPETFSYRKWLLLKMKEKDKNLDGVPSVVTSNVPSVVTPYVTVKPCCQHPATCDGDNSTVSPSPCVLSEAERVLVEHEMEVCESAADRYPNNYNAWSHRSWVIQQFAAGDVKLLESELRANLRFVSLHVSDYSGFHHRQFLLEQLQKCSPDGREDRETLQDECSVMDDMIRRYVGHEAIWCHRRYVLQRLATIGSPAKCDACTRSRAEMFNPKKTKLQSSGIDWSELCKKEEAFCASVSQETTSSWQRSLSERHLQWLRRTRCQNNVL